eukprot:GILK01000650.1.p1 GENE.GILK01000650.1~~GILK01000650.1.p1  ORF type:complete len:348 (-),score=74.69 GILK01000650.1:82-1086(-)
MGAFVSQPRIIINDDLLRSYRNTILHELDDSYQAWIEQGQKMGLTKYEFAQILGLTQEVVEHFDLFDTDHNGLVDAFEVFCGSAVFSRGELQEKAKFVFNLFDFNNNQRISLVELIMLLQAICRGVSKLAKLAEPGQQELEEWATKAFRFLQKDDSERMSLSDFTRWADSDQEVKNYIDCFTHSYDPAEADAVCQRLKNTQAGLFRDIYDPETKTASVDDFDDVFKRSMGGPSDEEFEQLVQVLDKKHNRRVHIYDFLEAMDAWNAFDAADVNGDRVLNIKELGLLLWLRDKKEPSEAKTREMMLKLDTNRNQTIERMEWVQFVYAELQKNVTL